MVKGELTGRKISDHLFNFTGTHAATAMTVFTIGYEGLGLDAFMLLLTQNCIDTVVDIRELPLSRKPGFSKKALENLLNMSGLEYVHMVDLGCPKPIRDCYRQDKNWKRYTEKFLQYLSTQEDAIVKLVALATSSNCALLCYEAEYTLCHRSIVADAVKRCAGIRVKHIQCAQPKIGARCRLSVGVRLGG